MINTGHPKIWNSGKLPSFSHFSKAHYHTRSRDNNFIYDLGQSKKQEFTHLGSPFANHPLQIYGKQSDYCQREAKT